MGSDNIIAQTDALAREMGISPAEIARREAFLEFTAEDADALAAVHDALESCRPQIIDALYRHLGSFDELQPLLGDDHRLDRLKEAQSAYFESLTQRDRDWGSVLQLLRIGMIHQRIGLEPKWYLGAYRKYVSELLRGLWRLQGRRPEQFIATFDALLKRVMFDIELALETYFHADHRAIAEKERFSRTVLETIPIGIGMADAELRVRYLNPALAGMFGLLALGEYWGREVNEIVPIPGLSGVIARTLASGKAEHEPLVEAEGQDGIRYYTLNVSHTTVDEAVMALFTVQEVTRTVQGERALREGEERLRTITDNVPAMISYVDADERFRFANKAYDSWVGRPAVTLLGQTLREAAGEEVYAEIRPYIEAVLKRGEVVRYERCERLSGQPRWLRVTFVPHVGEGGGVLGFYVLAENITEFKLAQQQILELAATLEERVEERTAALLRANQDLESFSYSVSHDLRAPLRAVASFAGILADEHAQHLDEGGRDYLRRIGSACKRMGRMISGILDLSRTSRQQIDLREVDLSAMAKELVAELRREDPGRSAGVVIEEGLVVKGDEPLLRVMMQNLLGNAWKYTSARPDGRAEISFGSIASAGCDVPVFHVKDNGAGFDMAYAGRMFGMFQRLHGATEYPGEGIGLATTQRIIERHCGRIWAQGAPGRGATFFFTLWEK